MAVVVDVALGVRDMVAGSWWTAEARVAEAFASVGAARTGGVPVGRRFWSAACTGAVRRQRRHRRARSAREADRELTDRAFDIGFTMFDTAFTGLREGARIIPNMATGLVGDFEHAVELASAGRWGDAFGELAKSGLVFATAPLASVSTWAWWDCRALRASRRPPSSSSRRAAG